MSSVFAFLHSPIGPDLVRNINVVIIMNAVDATAVLHNRHPEYRAVKMKMVKMKSRRVFMVKPVCSGEL